MLTYNLEERGKTPLYEYLYICIKNDILDEKLAADEKMPSKRELAKNLGISVVTVQNAYEQLIAEGYITAIEKKGYFVNRINMFRSNINITTRADIPETRDTGDTAFGGQKYFADFKTNNINYDMFPFSVWSKIMREVLSEREKAFIQNIPSVGLYELRKAIADNLYRFRGMNVSCDRIIVGAGTEYLYSIIIQLIGRDSVVAVEDPGYSRAAQVYMSNGVVCEYIPLDKFGMDISVLEESCANIAHISPSHHFPTGIVMPIKRRHQLLEWACERADRYIVEDDYDSEFRFVGRPVPTMQSIDYDEKVIYVNTFSKTIMPSIRIAYMILPERLMNVYRKRMSFYACTVSGFEQMTLARFIKDGGYERHINRMRNYYRSCRNMVISEIKKSCFGKDSGIMEENSGLHFILKLRTGLEDDELVRLAAENGVNISCVSGYCKKTADSYKHMVIINYSNVEECSIKKAVGILAAIANTK